MAIPDVWETDVNAELWEHENCEGKPLPVFMKEYNVKQMNYASTYALIDFDGDYPCVSQWYCNLFFYRAT